MSEQDKTLLEDGWSRLQHETGERCRYIYVLRGSRRRKRLSVREFQIVYLTALGLASKEVAAELGLAPTSIRATSVTALRKLGLSSCTQVPAFWHVLGKTPTLVDRYQAELTVFHAELEPYELPVLTSAERALLLHVVSGDSNPTIAARRGTSRRTVANQLAKLFGKYRVSSRVELAARALRVETSCKHDQWLGMPTSREAKAG